MKKLTLVFLFLISATNVFAMSESKSNCETQYTSSDSVASVEADVAKVETQEVSRPSSNDQ